MLRRSHLAVLATALFVSAAAAPPAQASPTESSASRAAPTEPKTQPAATFVVERFAMDSVNIDSLTMRQNAFHPGDVAEAPESVRVARWSPRLKDDIQKGTFDRAFISVIRSGDFSPGSFSDNFLTSLVDFAGPDNVKTAARQLRLGSLRYRTVLRAIAAADSGRNRRS